jgi:hypothetical protein
MNPLTTGQLDGARYLCLHYAANTSLNQFPSGMGDMKKRALHQRRARFEEALRLMRGGENSLINLGITAEDCAWAISHLKFVKNEKEWVDSFQKAEEILREHEK